MAADRADLARLPAGPDIGSLLVNHIDFMDPRSPPSAGTELSMICRLPEVCSLGHWLRAGYTSMGWLQLGDRSVAARVRGGRQ